VTLNPAIQTAKNVEYAKEKGVEPKKAAVPLGESVFFSKPFCFRVVRVFRASTCGWWVLDGLKSENLSAAIDCAFDQME